MELEHLFCKGRLGFSLKKTCYLINIYKYLIAGCKEDRSRLFSAVHNDGTRGNGDKLKARKCFLSIRKENHTLTVRVAEHWNTLLREVMESQSLEIVKIQLGQGPGQLALGDPDLSGEVRLNNL